MSDRTTGQTVIEIFNNWFLNEHGMLPEQAIERIHDLEAQLARVRELPCFHIETTYPMMDKGPSIRWFATNKGEWVRADQLEAALDDTKPAD